MESRQIRAGPLALDGKAASEQTEWPNPERVLTEAVAHGSGLHSGRQSPTALAGRS